jgi:hypothetical protein
VRSASAVGFGGSSAAQSVPTTGLGEVPDTSASEAEERGGLPSAASRFRRRASESAVSGGRFARTTAAAAAAAGAVAAAASSGRTRDSDDDDDTAQASASSSNAPKAKKDNRNYVQNPKETFISTEEIRLPDFGPFERNGEGRSDMKRFESMRPIEILDVLFEPVMDHVVEMYNKQPKVVEDKIKKLTKGKLKAFYGLSMFTYEWKHADLRAYWGGGTYAKQPKPDLSVVMPVFRPSVVSV